MLEALKVYFLSFTEYVQFCWPTGILFSIFLPDGFMLRWKAFPSPQRSVAPAPRTLKVGPRSWLNLASGF